MAAYIIRQWNRPRAARPMYYTGFVVVAKTADGGSYGSRWDSDRAEAMRFKTKRAAVAVVLGLSPDREVMVLQAEPLALVAS
jgi:hypothetical protein